MFLPFSFTLQPQQPHGHRIFWTSSREIVLNYLLTKSRFGIFIFKSTVDIALYTLRLNLFGSLFQSKRSLVVTLCLTWGTMRIHICTVYSYLTASVHGALQGCVKTPVFLLIPGKPSRMFVCMFVVFEGSTELVIVVFIFSLNSKF